MALSDPEQLVRDAIAAGMPLDHVAERLRSEGVNPVDAIKALRAGAGIHLGEAKLLVDRTLPPEWQEENDRLRGLAEKAVQLQVLVADFLHGGIANGSGNRGCVFLSPKAGDRSGFSSEIQAQFDRMGVKASEGLSVHLVDSTPDLNDNGVPSHIEVHGTLAWVNDGFGWRAFYDTDSVTWVPDAESDCQPGSR